MSSALGVALGMDDTYTWTQVVTALTGVATKTSGSQSVTTSGKWGFDTTYGPWLYIPTNGYYKTAHWLNIPWNTIKSSLGTSNTGQVLSGYTFTSQNGIKLSGNMANKGAVSASITKSGGSYTIPAGYHNGSGKVTGPTLAALNTDATFSSGGATLMTSTSTTATTSNKTISGSGLLIVIASCGVSSNFTFTPSASKVSGTGTLTSKLTFSNASCFSGAQVLQNVRIYSVSGASSLVYKASVTGTSGCGWIGIAAFFVKM